MTSAMTRARRGSETTNRYSVLARDAPINGAGDQEVASTFPDWRP